MVFFLAAGIYTVGAIVYLIFGSGERQSWAEWSAKPSSLMLDFRYKPSATDVLIEVLDSVYQNTDNQNNVHGISAYFDA